MVCKLIPVSAILVLLFLNSRSQDCSAIGGSQGQPENLGTSGNPQIDQIIIQELQNLSKSFGVHPAFYFFDDGTAHNAFSTSESLKDFSADGTVVFGRGLHRDQIARSQWGTNVPIILAHEFAHTVARKFQLDLPTKQNELFADYLAGGYMYYRNRDFRTTDIQSAFQAFFNMGDNDFTGPDHHGTPESRSRCIRQGYMDCKNADAAGHNFTLAEGVQLGQAFVTTNDLP